jgi:hypothetical protein
MEDARCRRGGVVGLWQAPGQSRFHIFIIMMNDESHHSKPCHAHSHETRILSPALSFMNSATRHGNESPNIAASASVAAASTLLDFQARRKSRGQLEYCR